METVRTLALRSHPRAPWEAAAIAHSSCSLCLGRYRIRSSIKLVHPAARNGSPPVVNLVEVEPCALAHGSIAQLPGRSTSAAFADFIIREFDMATCQVAYHAGADSWLLPVVSDAAREAIRNDELRLTGCAFQMTGVGGTISQLRRICKYVDRGFRLPTGRLAAAPRALLDEPCRTNVRELVCRLLKGRLHWEPVTPPRSAAPARRPYPLTHKFAKKHSGQWRAVPPRSSAVAQQLKSATRDCAASTRGLSPLLLKHAEALAVWTFVKMMQAAVYQTKMDMRSCVPQYDGWRVLGQLRRTGKGVDRFDLCLWPPDVLPGRSLRSLRPTSRAVRSFRQLKALLVERFASTAWGDGGTPATARQQRLRHVRETEAPQVRMQSAGGEGTCRAIRKGMAGEVTNVLKLAGDDDAQS